jgi:ubiquinol-cytochrome c reductase cytochrome c subunit
MLLGAEEHMKLFRDQSIAAVMSITILGLLSLALSARAQEAKTASAPAANVENGKRLFMKDGCYQCHGREGQGSNMSGPRIAPNPPPLEVILGYVRKPTGEMPPYTAKVISDAELADIHAYLQSRPPAEKDKAEQMLK